MTAPPPTEAADLALTHLRTRYEARDDAAHLATLGPEALVVVGDLARPRHELADAEVLAAWAQAPGPVAPHFVDLRIGGWDPDGARGVVAVDALDAREERRWQIQVGVERNDGGWRVAFAALAEPATPPSGWEATRREALAELTSLRAMAAGSAVTSLLDAGWLRRAWLPRQRLLALPETRFTCAGSGVCCTHDLTIGIDANAQRFVEAIDWTATVAHHPVGPFLEALPEAASGLVPFRHRLAREPDGRCKFLTPDNRCAIHALAGRAVFKPCHVFPYRFALTPDGICVTTNAMCPTARACLGRTLAEQEPDLRARLAVADVNRVERYYLRPGEEVAWDTFKTIEGQLLQMLLGDAPIKRKLWVALRWLSLRLERPSTGVHVAWYDEPAPRLGWLGRLAFRRFPALFDPCFRDLAGVEAGEGIFPEFEAELTRFFRAYLFGKATTYPYGLVAGLNYAAMTLVVLERQLQRHAARGISEAFWREFYAVIISGTYAPILQAIHQRPATGFARQAGDPRFGLTLLRLYDAVPAGAPPSGKVAPPAEA